MSSRTAPTELDVYLRELGILLDRIERSATHYQALGLDPSSSTDDVKQAYTRALRLHPRSRGVTIDDPALDARVLRAYERLAESLAVLANFGKRVAYDNSLVSKRASGPLPKLSLPPPPPVEPPAAPAPERAAVPAPPPMVGGNRRAAPRVAMKIPVHVNGVERDRSKWKTVAYSVDVSRTGVLLQLDRVVRRGRVLYLSMPLPYQLRAFGHADDSYRVFAIVRRVEPLATGALVALEFLGQYPPAAWRERPWALFTSKSWSGSERRRAARVERELPFGVTLADPATSRPVEVLAYSENVSPGGARLRVETPVPEVDHVHVLGLVDPFTTRAAVRNRYVGPDGHVRLCLQFLDGECPITAS